MSTWPSGVARRWWPLAALATLVTALALVEVLPRWPGLGHQVALPPLDLFADIRVLVAEAPSPGVFVVGLAAALAVRVTVLALLLRPSARRVGFALCFYLVAMPLGILAAALDASARAMLYAYVHWAGLLATLGAFVALAAAPWVGSGRMRDALAHARKHHLRVGALILYLIVLGALGTMLRHPGDEVQIAVVPLSAALTAVCATRLEAAPRTRVPRRVFAGLVAAILSAFVLLVALAYRTGDPPQRAARRAGSLLLVAGVDTSTGKGSLYGLDPRALGYSCAQTFYFSYAGQGSGGPRRGAACPIRTGAPYHPADTLRPLAVLAAAFRDQVADLPRPVTVVTHSQGAWVAWAGLAARQTPSVRDVVMLGAFPGSLADYPPPGRDDRGAIVAAALRALTDTGRAIGLSNFDPDAPLARELQATPGAVEALLAQPLPRRTRAAALLSRWDLPLIRTGWPRGVLEACPGWSPHGHFPRSAPVLETARDLLERRTTPGCPTWVRALGHATEAFGAPRPRR